jgi:hypothetical protein
MGGPPMMMGGPPRGGMMPPPYMGGPPRPFMGGPGPGEAGSGWHQSAAAAVVLNMASMQACVHVTVHVCIVLAASCPAWCALQLLAPPSSVAVAQHSLSWCVVQACRHTWVARLGQAWALLMATAAHRKATAALTMGWSHPKEATRVATQEGTTVEACRAPTDCSTCGMLHTGNAAVWLAQAVRAAQNAMQLAAGSSHWPPVALRRGVSCRLFSSYHLLPH